MSDAGEFAFDAVTQGAKIVFKDGRILERLQEGPERMRRAAWLTAISSAPDVENYMKNNAPWQDQTGNARSGLRAEAYRQGDEIGIVLSHSVSYGLWLEVRWNGKFAIIDPTIEAMGPVVMRRFHRLMDRMN